MPHHHIQYVYDHITGPKKIIVINMMRPYPGIMWVERTMSRFLKRFNFENYKKTLQESFMLQDKFGLKNGDYLLSSHELMAYQPFEVRDRLGFLCNDLEKLQNEIKDGIEEGKRMQNIISGFMNS